MIFWYRSGGLGISLGCCRPSLPLRLNLTSSLAGNTSAVKLGFVYMARKLYTARLRRQLDSDLLVFPRENANPKKIRPLKGKNTEAKKVSLAKILKQLPKAGYSTLPCVRSRRGRTLI